MQGKKRGTERERKIDEPDRDVQEERGGRKRGKEKGFERGKERKS